MESTSQEAVAVNRMELSPWLILAVQLMMWLVNDDPINLKVPTNWRSGGILPNETVEEGYEPTCDITEIPGRYYNMKVTFHAFMQGAVLEVYLQNCEEPDLFRGWHIAGFRYRPVDPRTGDLGDWINIPYPGRPAGHEVHG